MEQNEYWQRQCAAAYEIGEADLAYTLGRGSGWLGYGGSGCLLLVALREGEKHGGRMCAECVLWSGPHGVGFFSVGSLAFIGGAVTSCDLRVCAPARACVFSVFMDQALGRIGALGLRLFLLLVRSFCISPWGGLHTKEEANPRQHFPFDNLHPGGLVGFDPAGWLFHSSITYFLCHHIYLVLV